MEKSNFDTVVAAADVVDDAMDQPWNAMVAPTPLAFPRGWFSCRLVAVGCRAVAFPRFHGGNLAVVLGRNFHRYERGLWFFKYKNKFVIPGLTHGEPLLEWVGLLNGILARWRRLQELCRS